LPVGIEVQVTLIIAALLIIGVIFVSATVSATFIPPSRSIAIIGDVCRHGGHGYSLDKSPP
jgi:hypothetical protein